MKYLSVYYGVVKNSSGVWEEFVGRADKDFEFHAVIWLESPSSLEKLEDAKTAKGEIIRRKIGNRECCFLGRLGVKVSILRSLKQYTDALRQLEGEFTVAEAEEALGVELKYLTPADIEEMQKQEEEKPTIESPLPEVVDGDEAFVFSEAIKAYVQKLHTPKHNGSHFSLHWHRNGRIEIRKDGALRGIITEKATEVEGKIFFDWELEKL